MKIRTLENIQMLCVGACLGAFVMTVATIIYLTVR